MEGWERTRERNLRGGWVRRDELPRGPGGRNLCRWCNLEVPPGRFTFCSEFCVEEWKLRTDPSFLREKTFERDRGICAVCGVDTVAAYNEIRRRRGLARLKLLQHWGLKTLNRRSLWDADHIVAVVEGGGACDLSNIRTLCLICHRKASAELRERLRTVNGSNHSERGT